MNSHSEGRQQVSSVLVVVWRKRSVSSTDPMSSALESLHYPLWLEAL